MSMTLKPREMGESFLIKKGFLIHVTNELRNLCSSVVVLTRPMWWHGDREEHG